MKAAKGIGPVAVIASESCFARGVDHCLASEEDHLIEEQGGTYLQRGALDRYFRT